MAFVVIWALVAFLVAVSGDNPIVWGWFVVVNVLMAARWARDWS